MAFRSVASDLVAGQVDANGGNSDVFLYDRQAQTTTLVSHAAGAAATTGNSQSDTPVLSGDGAYVAFRSVASNLVAGQVGGGSNVFLYDRAGRDDDAGEPRGGGAADDGEQHLGHAGDQRGRGVRGVPERGEQQQPGGGIDVPQQPDVFLYDRQTGTTTLVSHAAGAAATTGNSQSDTPVISGDGAVVAFRSNANNLVTNQVDANGGNGDVFLYNRQAQTTTLVSHAAGAAATTGNSQSDTPVLSGDGAYVAFRSVASDLDAALTDTNGFNDVFLSDIASGVVTGLSRRDAATASLVGGGDSFVSGSATSEDGRFTVFVSQANNLVAGQSDTNFGTDVFLYDRQAQTTTLVSHAAGAPLTTGNSTSDSPRISAAGAYVAFRSVASNLVAGQVGGGSNVFLYDRQAQTTTLVSHAAGAPLTTGNSASSTPVLSGDGVVVAFRSNANNLVTNQVDANGGNSDVFLYDRQTQTTTLVSHAAGAPLTTGNNTSDTPVISGDGAYVAFRSNANNLVTNQVDANGGNSDVFLYDRQAQTTTLVSHAAGAPLTTGNNTSDTPVISGDGAYVAFRSVASDLVAGQVDANGGGLTDVFLYDRQTGTTTLVSHAAGAAATTGNSQSDTPVISEDGAYVAFRSFASDLVAGLTFLSSPSVFLYDRQAQTTTLVSHAAGAPLTTGNSTSDTPVISGDGAYVAFRGFANNLVAGLTFLSSPNVFLYDRQTGTATLASHVAGAPLTTGNNSSDTPVISGDGSSVAFRSFASNLVAGDLNGTGDVFLFAATPADVTPPETQIDAGPSGLGNSASAAFQFSGTDDVTPVAALAFQCRLDGGAWSACTSPTPYSGLGDGSHTFEVRAIDAASNTDSTPAGRSWTVDTTQPTITLTTPGNGATYLLTQPVLASYSCADPSGIATCSGPVRVRKSNRHRDRRAEELHRQRDR